MAANAAPLVLGGMALFLLSRRGDDESATAPALPEPDPPMEFSCDNLFGVWHVEVDGGLPITFRAYRQAYDFIQARFLDGGDLVRRQVVADTLDLIATGCHWEDQMQYTERMKDVYDSVQTIYGIVVDGAGYSSGEAAGE